MNRNTANMLGISSARIRALCIIISTVFAAMSQLLLIADYGTMNVYTGHLGIDTYAAAAILVGGATIKQAKIRNCFIGYCCSTRCLLPLHWQGRIYLIIHPLESISAHS